DRLGVLLVGDRLLGVLHRLLVRRLFLLDFLVLGLVEFGLGCLLAGLSVLVFGLGLQRLVVGLDRLGVLLVIDRLLGLFHRLRVRRLLLVLFGWDFFLSRLKNGFPEFGIRGRVLLEEGDHLEAFQFQRSVLLVRERSIRVLGEVFRQ